MSTENLIVTLGLQDKGASKQITALNKEIRFLDKEFKSVSKTSKEYENGTASLEKKLSILEKKVEANKSKLDAYKRKMEETKTNIAKKKEELEKLTNAENVNEKAVAKATEQLEKMEQSLRDTSRNIDLTENEVQDLNSQLKNTEQAIKVKPIEDYKRKMAELGKQIEETGERVNRFGQGLSSVGSNIQKWSAPFVAAGVASSKMFMDFEAGMENVNTLLDDTTNLEGYKNAVKRLSNDTGINIGIMTDGIYQAISSLGDSGEETEKMFTTMARSAKAGGADVADSVALISAGMKGYGQVNDETAKKISDLAFQTAKLGVTTFPEMAKSMQPLFPLSSSLGLSLEELFGVMATGTGVVGNTSEVSTQFKAVMSNLMKPTTEMAKLMKKYGFSSGEAMIKSKGLTGTLEILKKETGGSSDKMAKLFSSTEALTLMTALCGDQFEVFKEKSSAMNSSMDATDTAFNKVSSTTKDKLITNINKLKNSFLDAGEKLKPMIDSFVDGIGNVADAISNMDGEQLASIIKMGTWAMGVGTAVNVAGKFTQSAGSIISLFGKLTPSVADASTKTGLFSKGLNSVGGLVSKVSPKFGGMIKGFSGVEKASGAAAGSKGIGGFLKIGKLFSPAGLAIAGATAVIGVGMKAAKTSTELYGKSTLTAKEDLSTFEKVVSKFNGTQFKSREELESTNLVFKEFGEGISEDFAKAVETAHDKVNQFTFELNKISADGVINAEEHASFQNQVTELCDGAISIVKEKGVENQNELKNMFNSDGVLSEEEVKTLEALTRITENTLTEISERKARILEIENKAREDQRALNDEEKAEIEKHLQEISRMQLESLGTSQEEIAFSKNEFAARIQTMSAEQAGELLQQKKAEMDEEIIQIQAGYDTQIEMLKGNLSNMNEEERANAEKAIAQLEEDKALKISSQESLYSKYLDIINEKNPEILETINKYNGEELTHQDIKAQEKLNKIASEFEGINDITESGSYRMYNTQRKAYEDLEVIVNDVTGEIVGVHNRTKNQVGGYTDEWASSLKELGKEQQSVSQEMSDALSGSANATVTAKGEIVDANGFVVGSLEDVEEQADGTLKAMIKLGDEKVEIETNADGTIKDMETVKSKMDNIPRTIESNINYRFRTYGSPPSEATNGGRSINIPMSKGVIPATEGLQGATPFIASLPSIARDMPQTFDNMIVEPRYYSKESPILSRAISTLQAPDKSISNASSQIDYSLLGEVVAKAVSMAIENLKIEPKVEAYLDGNAITNHVSSSLAMNVKGRR